MKLFNKTFTIVLLVLCGLLVRPAWSTVDDDDSDEDVVINDDVSNAQPDAAPAAETTDDEATEDAATSLSSPHVTTTMLFIKPENTEFPAGKLVKLIVGFHNNGTNSFVVDSIDASLRYPQDFSYYIQNFTAFGYNKVVEAEKEATFEYGFTPSETFSSRSFGLVVNIFYKDLEGKVFVNGLFNDTINVIEPDEGFDGETFFLYVILVGIVVLLFVVVQQFFSSSIKKRVTKISGGSGKVLSNGGSSNGDIDYEWIPKEHLQTNKTSPRTSPRLRKTKSTNSGSEPELSE